jgi:hypothetical protein
MTGKTEEVEVRGLQWLESGHYRKNPPKYGYNPHDWNPLMTVTQHQRLLEAERQRRWDGNEISSRDHAEELEEAKQGKRVLAHEVAQLKGQSIDDQNHMLGIIDERNALRAQVANKVVLPEQVTPSKPLNHPLLAEAWAQGVDDTYAAVARLNGAKP